MMLNYFAGGEVVKACDFLKVEAKFGVVADGDFDGFALQGSRRFSTLLAFPQVHLDGGVVGIDTFGESAPAAALFEHFRLNTQAVIDEARRVADATRQAPG